MWRYTIDLDAGTVRYTARNSDYTVDLPLEPMHRHRRRRPGRRARRAPRSSRTRTAGTWTPRSWGRHHPVPRA